MSSERDEGEEPGKGRDPINENLKRVYDKTLKEPLPDRLAELLERLKQRQPK